MLVGGGGVGAEDGIEKTQKKGITIVGIVWLLSFFNWHSVSNQVEYRAGQGRQGRKKESGHNRKRVAKCRYICMNVCQCFLRYHGCQAPTEKNELNNKTTPGGGQGSVWCGVEWSSWHLYHAARRLTYACMNVE